jgi:hypothetical protein
MLTKLKIAPVSGMNILASIDGNSLIHGLIFLLIAGVVLGILYWLIQSAPFLNALFKQVLGWLVILFGALILINVLLGLVGHPLVNW